MNLTDKKEIINVLIKKLEKIRDTEKINEINIIPYEEVEEFQMINGTVYAILQTTINIKHEKLYQKGDPLFDDFIYKEV